MLAIAMVQSVQAGAQLGAGLGKINSSTYKGEMLGVNGVKPPGVTVWKGEGKERIDVENPSPGVRASQIHYQDNVGNKYCYDPNTNLFVNQKSQELAPKSVQNMLKGSSFSKAIDKALYNYLEEKNEPKKGK